jgi:hypothetical protein
MAESWPENPEEDVRTRPDEEVMRIADAIVIVDLPDRPSTQPARVWSPRPAHPEPAAFFAKQMMPEDRASDSSQSTSKN